MPNVTPIQYVHFFSRRKAGQLSQNFPIKMLFHLNDNEKIKVGSASKYLRLLSRASALIGIVAKSLRTVWVVIKVYVEMMMSALQYQRLLALITFTLARAKCRNRFVSSEWRQIRKAENGKSFSKDNQIWFNFIPRLGLLLKRLTFVDFQLDLVAEDDEILSDYGGSWGSFTYGITEHFWIPQFHSFKIL